MEEWKNGRMEEWKIGRREDRDWNYRIQKRGREGWKKCKNRGSEYHPTEEKRVMEGWKIGRMEEWKIRDWNYRIQKSIMLKLRLISTNYLRILFPIHCSLIYRIHVK